MADRPTLLSSCAFAATAVEAGFRIQAPITTRRSARVITMDPASSRVLETVSGRHAPETRTLRYEGDLAGAVDNGHGAQAPSGDLMLRAEDGSVTRLSSELEEADLVIVVATAGGVGAAVDVIGVACAQRGIGTAGLIVGSEDEVGPAVSALRSHARVLMVTRDSDDVLAVLTALRA
jgi:hypothetical protein